MENNRLAAVKVRIKDLLGGKFFPGNKEGLKPSYVIDGLGRKVLKASIVGTVTDIFVNADSNYMSVTLDDGSSAIRIKMFGEDTRINSNIKVGDELAVVGKVRQYNEELYISPETIKKAEDFNYVMLRKLEILKGILESKKTVEYVKSLADNGGVDAAKKYVESNAGLGQESVDIILSKKDDGKANGEDKVVNIIENLGGTDGIDSESILKESRLNEAELDSIITKLLDAGTIFEPHVGRFKVVG